MKAHHLQRLQHQYDQINDLLADLDMPFVLHRHIPDKWSIHEHIAHLGRYQEITESRWQRILQEEEPLFDRYVAAQDEVFEAWRRLPMQLLWSKVVCYVRTYMNG